MGYTSRLVLNHRLACCCTVLRAVARPCWLRPLLRTLMQLLYMLLGQNLFKSIWEKDPAIIFIDEIDAIATKRFDAQTGADREVQRILLELLNQMDGFDQTTNVKVIMATNRQDTLDPALLRPGRLD